MKVNVPINSVDTVILLVLAVLFILGIRIVIGFFQKPKAPAAKEIGDERYKAGSRIVLTIDGMMCGMCENHMKDAVRAALPEVRGLSANYTTGEVGFILPEAFTGSQLKEKLHEKIDPTGYRLLSVVCDRNE